MSVDSIALEVVEAALGIEDAEARLAFVADRCGEDAALRARVEALLAYDEAGFRLLPTESFIQPIGVIEAIPERIGPYRVTAEIARGGMGAVVVAERDDGVFHQRVAIKLIRGDLASERARARFAEERRILARLRHPGIVRILDGGEADGRPWLAMDHVEGLPVTEALRAAGADRASRLDAFEAVCEAVAYAHRSLVIHADIKPSNVLMTEAGGVQLLDFGIARLISAIDTDEAGDPYPLTRGYAAPERALGLAPTIAGDVFSLGVLLLAMLDARLPADDGIFVPGTHLPRGALAGDLAAIAGCALAARPERRYPDVAALLGDVRRHRGWRPVKARGDADWRYVAGCFARRNRRPLLIAGAIAGLLVATSAISTVQFFRAERARTQADARFMELRGLARYMLFEHYDRLADAPGTVAARGRLAEVAGHYLDRLRTAPGAPADLRLDTARGYRRLATILGLSGTANLGRPDDAATALGRAEALLAPMARETPDDPAVQIELGWVTLSRWTLASDPRGVALSGQAREHFAQALALQPGNAEALLGALTADRARVFDLEKADDHARSLALARQTLAQLRAGRFPPALASDARMLEVSLLNRIGDATYYGDDIPGALTPYREAEGLILAELAKAPSVRWEESLGEARYNVSSTLAGIVGRDAEALAEADRGVAEMERALSFGPDAAIEMRLIILLGQRSLLLHALGRIGEAEAASLRGIALRRQRLAAMPADMTRRRDLAVGLAAHADLLTEAGDRPAACQAAREGVELLARLRRSGDLSDRDIRIDVPKLDAAASRHCE